MKPAHVSKGGTRYYSEEQRNQFLGIAGRKKPNRITIGYCRVSSNKQKDDLERQIENVKTYMIARGYQFDIIQDIGSGINYNKKGLNQLINRITNGEINKVVILYKDRLIRFGYELIENLCNKYGTEIEIIDNTEKTEEQELVEDLIQIVTVFSCRLQGKRAKKVRLRPTEEQEKQLWQSSGTARWIFNWTLKMQEMNHRFGGKFISNNDLRKHITKMKQCPKYAWLNNVSNNIAKQAVKDACNAYKKWFDGMTGKSPLKAEKPRFKARKKSKPAFYNDNIKLKVKHKSVLLEKIGWVKTSEKLPVNTKYFNPRISFDGKYWYVSVGIDEVQPAQSLTGEIIGIDLGIKDLAIVSNGRVYKNINKTGKVKKIEKRLRRLQRKVSRKYDMNKEGNRFAKTCNIYKLEREIRHTHRKLANIRQNHLHQTTTEIVKTKPSKIVVETLNAKGMMKNKHLAKSVAQQKFYEFKSQLQYKCEDYGIELVEADKFYPSSKLCHECGHKKVDLKLSDRTYHCEECGYTADRDYNASLNLASYSA